MVKITGVEKGSRADRAGVLAGDMLVSINDNEINDVLDYRFYLAERTVRLSLLREGEPIFVKIKKGEYDDVGLMFETALMDKKQTCKNGCIFCFYNISGIEPSAHTRFKHDKVTTVLFKINEGNSRDKLELGRLILHSVGYRAHVARHLGKFFVWDILAHNAHTLTELLYVRRGVKTRFVACVTEHRL